MDLSYHRVDGSRKLATDRRADHHTRRTARPPFGGPGRTCYATPVLHRSARHTAARAGVAIAIALIAMLGGPPASGFAADATLPRVGGRIDTWGIVRFDHASPSQNPEARVELWAEQRPWTPLRWRFSLIGRAGGPPKDPEAGVFDLGHTFQNLSPSLQFDDAFVHWSQDSLDVRAGLQRFFWGRLDGAQPNDLLSPRQYEDPFLTDERDAKIAVPALAIDWRVPASWRDALPDESRISLVWEPIDVPWRFPLEDERWFAPAARAAKSVAVGAIPDTPCPCDVAVTQTTRNAPAPARRFDNGNVGLRVSGRAGEADWAMVYFDGHDPAPNFDSKVRLSLEAGSSGVVAANAATQLQPAYRRFRSLGADMAMPIGGFTTRAEAAWRFRRPYPIAVDRLTDQILSNPSLIQRLLEGETIDLPAYYERDAVEWGIGTDTVYGDFLPLLELYQVILLHNDQPLLIRNVDTRLTANLRRNWLADRLESQLLATWGIEAGYELVRAQLAYTVTDGVQLIGGVLGIWGDRDSVIGQYDRNSEAYARLRYTF